MVIIAFAAVPLASSEMKPLMCVYWNTVQVYYFLSTQDLDGTLLSLSLTYTVTITYYVLACVLWASADVENYVSILLTLVKWQDY